MFVEAMTANTNNADRTEAEEIKHELAEKLPEEGRKDIEVDLGEHCDLAFVTYELDAELFMSSWNKLGFHVAHLATRTHSQELIVCYKR